MSFLSNLKCMLFSKKFPMVAVDISDTSIELLQLTAGGKLPKIKAYTRKNIPSNLIDGGKIMNLDKLAEHLKKAFEQSKDKFSNNSCLLSLPDQNVYFTIFKIKKDIKEIDQTIYNLASQKLPIDLDHSYFDYLVTDEKNKEIFLAAAAEQESVDQYIELFKKADLNLEVIDIESACLARSLLTQKDLETPTFILDIGARKTDIILVDQKGFRDQIDLPVAGNLLTSIIAKKLKLTNKQAEKLKREEGLLIKKDDLGKELAQQFDLVFAEIEKMCNNYTRKTEKKVNKIIMVGGSSLLKGLDEYIKKNYSQYKVVKGSPEKKVSMPAKIFKVDKVFYCNVIGLALRGLNQDSCAKGLNLIKSLKK